MLKNQSLKSFVAGALGALVVVGGYHLAVGYQVFKVNEALFATNYASKTTIRGSAVDLMLRWPQYIAAIDTTNALWVETMENTRRTLEEINSGRWERKAADAGAAPVTP